MSRTLKTIISLVLVIVLALELFPLSSLAVEPNVSTEAEDVEAVDYGEQVESPEAPNNEPYAVSEVEELREETVKHFRMSDGSFIAVQYGTPVHYKGESDLWKEIDNSLIAKDGKLVSKYGDVEKAFSQTLADGKLFDVTVGDYSLSMSLMAPGGNDDNAVMMAEEDAQEKLDTVVPDVAHAEADENIAADEQQAESAEVTEEPFDIQDPIKTESSAESTLTSMESAAAQETEESSIMRVVTAPSIKAHCESKAPKLVNASEHLTAADLATRELSTAEVSYANALPSVDLNYQNTTNSIKESIIIKEPKTSYSYSFLLTLKGVTAELQDDGSIACLMKDGDTVFSIPAPYMIDAAGATSLDAKYALEKVDSGWMLTITADETWMNDPDRRFPIVLDPTTIFQVGAMFNKIHATYVCEGTPSTTYSNNSTLRVGYGGVGLRQMQAFLAFEPFQVDFSYLQVVNAKLFLTQSSYVGTTQSAINITAHQVTSSPGEATISNWIAAMTWNNKPSFSSEILDHAKVENGTTDVCLDVTEAVKTWETGSTVTKALALSAYSLPSVGQAVSNLNRNETVLVISYRNDIGLEDYYTYQSYDVGNAGTAYISDHTGRLTVVTPLVSFSSTSNPFQLNLVYNNFAALFDRPFDVIGTKLGIRMQLNLFQIVRSKGEYLEYVDGDGTQHYFSKNNPSQSIYYDEDGLGLKIEVQDQWHSLMSDDHGNSWTFMNGILSIIQDGNGNQYEIHYIRGDNEAGNWHPCGNGDKLEKVVQKNVNGSEIVVASFGHDSNGRLTSITDYAGRTTTLNYSDANFLIGISRSGAQLVSFNHETELRITDCVSGCGIAFNRDPYKMLSVHYFGSGSNNNRETTTISYGTDYTTYTTNNVATTYLFDYAGRTINAYTTQDDFLVGAANAVYSGIGDTNRKNNRTTQTGEIGVTAHSWMRNGNYENTSAFTWTLSGAGTSTTNIVVNGDNPHTGNFALKGWLAANSNGTTTASHQTYSLRSDLKYAVSAYVNTHDISSYGTNGCIKLEVINAIGSVIAKDSIDFITDADIDDGWARLSAGFQASGIVTIRISAVNARGIFYADDVQVEPAAPGSDNAAPSNVNLIDNSNLQYYGSGWDNNGTNYCTDTGRGGLSANAYSLRAIGNPTQVRKASQTVPINLPGTESFILSGWAQANSVYTGETVLNAVSSDPSSDEQKRFGLCAELTYSDGAKEYHYAPFNSDLTSWQFTSVAVVPKQSTKTVATIKVSCVYNYNVGTAYFDDFSLVREVAQTMKYDNDGNLQSVNTTGVTADQSTFSSGKLIQTVTAGNGTLTYSYGNSNNSNLITKISNGAVKDSFSYDTRGNITQENYSSTAGGAPIRQKFQYSTDGNRLTKTTVFGNYYDADSPNQVVTNYSYGTNYNKMSGQPSKVSTFHSVVDYTYNTTYDRLTKVAQQNAGTLAYSYSNGNLDSLTRTAYSDSSSQTYSFTYNAFGDRTKSSLGTTFFAVFNYDDSNGNLTSMTYGNGPSSSFSYDALHRLTRKLTTTSGNPHTVDYVYNGNGDLYEKIDSSGETLRYRYDSLNRLAGLRRSGFNNTFNSSYQYDNCGRLHKYSYQIANLFNDSETFTYRTVTDSTGAAGAVEKIEMASGDTVDYSYDSLHRLSNRRIGSSIKESYNYATSYTGSTSLNTTMVDAKAIRDVNSNDTALYRWEYAYDRAGNIVQEIDTVANQTTTYTYDQLNQLTNVVSPSTTYTYSYDQAGNLQTAQIGNTTHTYSYGNSNWKDLLTAYDGHTITYDSIGNPLSYYNGSSNTLTWTEGRLLNTARKNNVTTTYSYDADGFRTRKVFSSGGRVDFYWDNGRLVGEARYTVLGIATNYIQYHYDETGSPVGFTNNGTDFYYAKNLQGDIVAIYKKVINNGTVSTSCVARYDYDPWGKCTVKTADGRVDILLVSVGHINPFRFKGYYYDGETGFYYLQSRCYDPAIGRFINADSFAATGQGVVGTNLFAYALNSPISMEDRAGMSSTTTHAYGANARKEIGDLAISIGLNTLGIVADVSVLTGATMATGGVATAAIATTVVSSLAYNFTSLTNNCIQLCGAIYYYVKDGGYSYTNVSLIEPTGTALDYIVPGYTIVTGSYKPSIPSSHNPFMVRMKPIKPFSIHVNPINLNIKPLSFNFDFSSIYNLKLNEMFITK